jgi:hypothetical protein
MVNYRSDWMSRRRVLQLGGVAGTMAAAGPLLGRGTSATAATSPVTPSWHHKVSQIESIIRAKGTVSSGVLNIEIDREDIPHVHKDGVPVKPAFEINGNLCFQELSDGSIMFNGDLCFKPEELQPAIDAMISHGLAWQAEHQHLYGLDPMVWFMHMRGRGTARAVAKGCAAILAATSTPLPQAPPKHPSTPLDVKRLSKIIGAPGTVSNSGVVTFDLPQRGPIMLGGVRISPFLNVYTPVAFQPLGGDQAVVVPDFGLQAHQVNNLAKTMRGMGWQLDCLYNQETDEHPQLYFSHHFKVGNAYELAKEVRKGLEQTSVVLR